MKTPCFLKIICQILSFFEEHVNTNALVDTILMSCTKVSPIYVKFDQIYLVLLHHKNEKKHLWPMDNQRLNLIHVYDVRKLSRGPSMIE
jgi:hypothetical protein